MITESSNYLNDFKVTDETKANFKKYYDFLISENKLYNLTAITEETEVYIKHFYDSLTMSSIIDLTKEIRLLDVGSGAGFPSIPLKLVYPSISLVIIEPTLKRVNFIKKTLEILGINDVSVIWGRAEDVAKDYLETFDIVTARAVAGLNILLELTIPFVKKNGYFIAYKGSSYQEEMLSSKNACKLLGCKVELEYEYELPNSYGKRYLLKIKKLEETNKKYPRKYKDIKIKPL